MSNHFPIPSPPEELVQQWLCSDDYQWGPLEQRSITITTNRLQNVATRAAQWGADQELEACCDHMRDLQWGFVERPDGGPMIHRAVYLEQARRPKPPTLQERALQLLERYDTSGLMLTADQVDTIRRALEALND